MTAVINTMPIQPDRTPESPQDVSIPRLGHITPPPPRSAGRRATSRARGAAKTERPSNTSERRHDHDCWQTHDECALRAAFDAHALRALWLPGQDGPADAIAEARRWAARFQAGRAAAARRAADPGLVQVARYQLARFHAAGRKGGARAARGVS